MEGGAATDTRTGWQTTWSRVAAGAARLEDRWRALDPGLKLAIWAVITLRLGLELVGYVSAQWEAIRPRHVPAWLLAQVNRGDLPGSWILSIWQRGNGLWYQYIAAHGYRAGNGSDAYQPLFPLLSHAVSLVVGGNLVIGELVVASLALGAAVWLLYRVARLEVGPVVSGLTVLLTVFFVTGFYLAAPYPDGLFLALALGAFLLARQGRFWWAGAVSALAVLASTFGVFLAAPLAYEHIRQRRAGGGRPGPALSVAAVPLLVVVLLHLYWTGPVGDRGAPWGTEGDWGGRLVAPWGAVQASLDYIGRTGSPIELLNLITLLGFAALAVFVVRRLPGMYAWYVIPYLLFLLCHQSARTPLMSDMRYCLALFPCTIVLALWLAPRRDLALGWLAVSGMVEVLLFEYWVHFHWVA